MKGTTKENEVIRWLVQWAEQQEPIRAMLLTSSRTNPTAPVDVFSDYDVVLVVTDIHLFHADDTWLDDFGKVLVVYRDPIRLEYGCETVAFITQYEDGTKIDYTLWPVEVLRRVVEEPELPIDLDVGYAILLDKDHMADRLKPPTYTAYIPTPPAEAAYRTVIEEFFQEGTYVAKYLWRDELMPLKYSLDQSMKLRYLRQMLEWQMEIAHGWSVKTGRLGKGLKTRLRPEIWSELESTYVGAGIEDNWDALFRTIALFRKVAIEVGVHLGYAYLHDLDRRATQYFQKVKNLDRRAETFR